MHYGGHEKEPFHSLSVSPPLFNSASPDQMVKKLNKSPKIYQLKIPVEVFFASEESTSFILWFATKSKSTDRETLLTATGMLLFRNAQFRETRNLWTEIFSCPGLDDEFCSKVTMTHALPICTERPARCGEGPSPDPPARYRAGPKAGRYRPLQPSQIGMPPVMQLTRSTWIGRQ